MKRLTNVLDDKNANESGGCTKNDEGNADSLQELSTKSLSLPQTGGYQDVYRDTVDRHSQWTIPQLIITLCRSDDNLPIQLEEEQCSPVAVNSGEDLPGGKESKDWNNGCLVRSCPDVTNKNDVATASTEVQSTHALSAGYPPGCEEPHSECEVIEDVVPLEQVFPSSHPPAVSVGKVTHVAAAENGKDEENADNQVNNKFHKTLPHEILFNDRFIYCM